METLTEVPTDLKSKQKITLINGKFSASEAADIIKDVLDVKINFHKIQRLIRTEGDLDDKCEYDSGRIDELINEKQVSKDFFSQARLQGKKLKMTSTIHISIEE